jgi:hypothetical protein
MNSLFNNDFLFCFQGFVLLSTLISRIDSTSLNIKFHRLSIYHVREVGKRWVWTTLITSISLD